MNATSTFRASRFLGHLRAKVENSKYDTPRPFSTASAHKGAAWPELGNACSSAVSRPRLPRGIQAAFWRRILASRPRVWRLLFRLSIFTSGRSKIVSSRRAAFPWRNALAQNMRRLVDSRALHPLRPSGKTLAKQQRRRGEFTRFHVLSATRQQQTTHSVARPNASSDSTSFRAVEQR